MSRATANIPAPRRSAGQTPPEAMWPLCPRSECQTRLKPQSLREQDPLTGLESMRGPACGHQGYVARQGVRILFSDRREYVLTYGPSLSTLTVLLSWSALTQFAPFHRSSAELAAHVAEWALLTGCVEGTVELYPDSAVLADCYEYLRHHPVK